MLSKKAKQKGLAELDKLVKGDLPKRKPLMKLVASLIVPESTVKAVAADKSTQKKKRAKVGSPNEQTREHIERLSAVEWDFTSAIEEAKHILKDDLEEIRAAHQKTAETFGEAAIDEELADEFEETVADIQQLLDTVNVYT